MEKMLTPTQVEPGMMVSSAGKCGRLPAVEIMGPFFTGMLTNWFAANQNWVCELLLDASEQGHLSLPGGPTK
jgi:hypothetical protein